MAKESAAEMVNASGVSYGDLIREYRKRRGMSQERLGQIAHVRKNAVGAWEAGRSRPDLASVPMLCQALDLPLDVFFGLDNGTDEDNLFGRYRRLTPYNRQIILKQMDLLYELQEDSEMAPRKLVKLYENDLSAAAGPVSYIGETTGKTIYLVSDPMTRLAQEIIRVSGDSMEPTFSNGDRVLVQHTSHLREGEIGIFVNGDAGYIKEYRRDGLYSHNPRYPVLRFDEEDNVRCIGRVLGKLRPDQHPAPEEIALFVGHRV